MPPIVCVAPMMGYTDRHARYLLRLMSDNVRLYTEMIVAQAVLYGDRKRLLDFDPSERYLALQLGGSDPKLLASAAKVGEEWGYDEINLNVGCPSDRVCAGKFGAFLMYEPELVAECISAMQAQVKIPLSIKCRLGVNEKDSYEDLHSFIKLTNIAGCQIFIIHARKALLGTFSPKQNRDIPPLCYQTVKRLKQDFPHLIIILNGGIQNTVQIKDQIAIVDGVMIGRSIQSNPYLLAEIHQAIFKKAALNRCQLVEKYLPYISQQQNSGISLHSLARHLLNLFKNQPGAQIWRRFLSEHIYKKEADIEVINQALKQIIKKSIMI